MKKVWYGQPWFKHGLVKLLNRNIFKANHQKLAFFRKQIINLWCPSQQKEQFSGKSSKLAIFHN